MRDHGYNTCAVIAGDALAFILAGDRGPEVAFVKPQSRGLVTPLEGKYSVDRRCEVLLQRDASCKQRSINGYVY